MQVVADGVPQRVWDAPTERIVERRQIIERRRSNGERRKPRGGIELAAPVGAPIDPWPAAAPTPAWNRVLAISLATFVCGALLATGVNRLRRRSPAPTVIAQVEPIQRSAPGLTPLRAAQPSAAAPPLARPQAQPVGPTVEPLPKLEAAPAPAAVAPPAIDSRREKRPAVAKLTPPTRGELELAARPRRAPPPPAKALRTTEPDPFDAARVRKPAGPRQWVDPFAD
ncbi:MAG TPA: hypothetical protein VIF57_32575 [Polyangia bacterium]|jgi:hypothetical protein